MMNSLWIAKTGMSAQQTKMDVVSHNLSNVSTTGYKRQNAVFEDLIYQNLRQVGAPADEQNNLPTGMHLGLGVRTVATTRNFQQGTPTETGKDLDVAISGDGKLLGIEDLGNAYMASVEFSGLIREEPSAGPNPFREVWNMTKPKDNSTGWLVAGLQALG